MGTGDVLVEYRVLCLGSEAGMVSIISCIVWDRTVIIIIILLIKGCQWTASFNQSYTALLSHLIRGLLDTSTA